MKYSRNNFEVRVGRSVHGSKAINHKTANEGHEYCLKTKYKNEFIKLNGENILLKEMQDKMIQQEGLCGSIKLQLSQDRIQVWVVKISLKDISSQGIIPVI